MPVDAARIIKLSYSLHSFTTADSPLTFHRDCQLGVPIKRAAVQKDTAK